MSNEAIYGLVLLAIMVLTLGGGIVLVNWLIGKASKRRSTTSQSQ